MGTGIAGVVESPPDVVYVVDSNGTLQGSPLNPPPISFPAERIPANLAGELRSEPQFELRAL